MKKISFLLLTLFCSFSWAASSVDFNIQHKKVSVYPGSFSFILNGSSGMRNNVSYDITCQISNPNQDAVPVQVDIEPYLVCPAQGGCGGLSLNGKSTSKMLQLVTGVNELKLLKAMTASYNPNTKLVFNNYDNDNEVFIENCTATLNF